MLNRRWAVVCLLLLIILGLLSLKKMRCSASPVNHVEIIKSGFCLTKPLTLCLSWLVFLWFTNVNRDFSVEIVFFFLLILFNLCQQHPSNWYEALALHTTNAGYHKDVTSHMRDNSLDSLGTFRTKSFSATLCSKLIFYPSMSGFVKDCDIFEMVQTVLVAIDATDTSEKAFDCKLNFLYNIHTCTAGKNHA